MTIVWGRKLRVAIALAALLAPALAGAAPQTSVALEYEVAADTAGCPDAAQFRASVARQLGYDPFRSPPASPTGKRVVVQIARTDPGFAGWIRWSDASGRWEGDRRLASRRSECTEIAASVAFAVAVQIQLLAALAPPAPALPPPPPVAAPPPPRAPDATARLEPSPVAAPPPPGRRLELSVGLGPALALGTAPHPTGLGRLFASGRRAWFSLEIALDAALPSTQREATGGGFSLDRFAAGAAACGHARPLAACLTATVGLLRARGFGVDAPASPTGTFSQVGARLAATRDLGGGYFAALRADGLVMLAPYTVTLNQAAAWTTPRVGALIGVDLGAHL
jgi:hypothetical protein